VFVVLTIGLLVLEILIDGAFSLKNKRSVLKRITKKIRDNFNISTSEIDYQDIWNKTKIAIVTVSSDSKGVDRVLQNVLNFIEDDKEVELLNSHMEKF
jgi:hypothetical protein